MEIKIQVNSYTIPNGITFAHSTRMADSWTSHSECIIMPEKEVGSNELSVNVFEGNTDQLRLERPTKNPIRLLHRYRNLDMNGKFIFDARYEIDTNVGHYIVDTIPKILTVKECLSKKIGREVDIYAILREQPRKMALDVFEALGIPVIATEANIRGSIVSMTGIKTKESEDKRIDDGGALMVGNLKDIYSNFRKKLIANRATESEKIFISRKFTRTIENESEINGILSDHGFKRYYFETGELSIQEQWQIVSQAKEIVAIHGAGMSPLIFNMNGIMRESGDLSGLRVIELYGAGYFVDWNRRLAAVMNAHWCGVRGKITPQIVRDLDDGKGGRIHESSSFRIDPNTLKLALKHSASASYYDRRNGV